MSVAVFVPPRIPFPSSLRGDLGDHRFEGSLVANQLKEGFIRLPVPAGIGAEMNACDFDRGGGLAPYGPPRRRQSPGLRSCETLQAQTEGTEIQRTFSSGFSRPGIVLDAVKPEPLSFTMGRFGKGMSAMVALSPSMLRGRYFVPDPGVLSVFAVGGRWQFWLVRRDWPFIVTRVSSNSLEAHNTTTGHILNLSMDEILTCMGDIDGPPDYHRPLVFHLNSQICWNARDLWKAPLGTMNIPGNRRPNGQRMLRAA